MKVGYARVSTKGQTPENQISELAETGCELFFEEKTSGAKKRRPAFEAVLEQIRADDIVGVTSLDRLTRSTPELLRIAEVFIKRTGNCSPRYAARSYCLIMSAAFPSSAIWMASIGLYPSSAIVSR